MLLLSYYIVAGVLPFAFFIAHVVEFCPDTFPVSSHHLYIAHVIEFCLDTFPVSTSRHLYSPQCEKPGNNFKVHLQLSSIILQQ